ncbi:MAG: response regulator [Verrucomicrobia bacterium]|nr:response regulator [Verrucomicrobiota bacterium]
MERRIHILMIEDEGADADLIQHHLRQSGVAFSARRVETESEFLDEIGNRPPDIILSDHGMPGFDGFAALALARRIKPEIPFIFVSGRHGEEDVVKSLKSGAADFVLKDRLSDLAPAITRALEEAELASRRTEETTWFRRDACLDILFATSVRPTPAPANRAGFSNSGRMTECFSEAGFVRDTAD